MEKVTVKIENCYGIRSFEEELDFSNKKAVVIYAPNGTMKTSFARTFKDYSNSVESRDRMYPDREPIREFKDENGHEIVDGSVFVIEPYLADYESSRLSTLLVNKDLKSEYDQILKKIESEQDSLIKLLRASSGIKTGIEDIVSVVFTKEPKNFLRALERVRTEVSEEKDSPFTEIKYTDVYSEKVEKFLTESDFKEKLSEYTKNYDDLLNGSRFFRKGVFNHYQAGEIAKQLKNHGFFKADHSVYLNDSKKKQEITSEKELTEVIDAEMQSILEDPKLRKSFDEIDTLLKANQELRAFREFLLNNQDIIPELTNPDLFKEKLWIAYLIANRDAFSRLMDEYNKGKARIQEITDAASGQATKWQDVINIFNRRFAVPFKVSIENKQDVILKRDNPNVTFEFKDDAGEFVSVARNDLVEILSSGENRALYILNIIFEIEARKEEGVPTLFVIDDIADSFDYKNKYAIVEYLHDILHDGDFRQVILTHNYDFYRTIWRRFELGGANFHILKSADKIELIPESMYSDPFQKWKATADDPDNKDVLIAMIPFVRNLAEYCGFKEESDQLTALLHIKPGTETITVKDLASTFAKVLNGHEFNDLELDETLVLDLIFLEAQKILDGEVLGTDLEKKVAISIAIRLRAEQFLISKINDTDFVAGITKNQTAKLINRYKQDYSQHDEAAESIKLMDRVNIMTPENIHLNSFMFEPILDMSIEHLTRLYAEICDVAS